MRHISLMGRVAVSFGISTILPLFLMFLMFRGVTTMDINVAILILAGLFFIGWIYMGIVKPVDQLKKAAKRIESGDLDFTLEAETHDEFGELMEAFEEMRLRLKETEEEKLKADQENRELISNIAHDLKTIRGYAEGILDGICKTSEMQQRYIQTIYNKANDMDRLIDELRYYVKIETNKIPYNYQHISVADYFQDCADDIGQEMETEGIAFSYSNAVDRSVEMIADPEQLRKVINNIISNSVKYMDKDEKWIHLDVTDAGDFVQVDMADNGKGISKTDLPYIFQRFFRADSARSSTKGGSGIGLSIVKKIIEDGGGRIWASSTEGEGTTIHFVIRKYLIAAQEDKK